MEFVKDPIKSKRVFILMLVLGIIFLVGAGVLGYFYYIKDQDFKSLTSEKQSLQTLLDKTKTGSTKSSTDLQNQVKTLQSQVTTLEKEKKDLQTQVNSDKTKSAKAQKYLAVLNYVSATIAKYNGLDGWTDSDYQQGRSLAEETNDTSFVNTVDWAWNTKDISQIVRLNGFLDAVSKGITANLP